MKYDGTGPAAGYFKVFEKLRPADQYSDERRVQHLIGKLEGGASAWLHGLVEDWSKWGYLDLKEQLLAHFGIENKAHTHQLRVMRCGAGQLKLFSFNQAFAMKAAAAVSYMGSNWVKDVYLDAIQPAELQLALRN